MVCCCFAKGTFWVSLDVFSLLCSLFSHLLTIFSPFPFVSSSHENIPLVVVSESQRNQGLGSLLVQNCVYILSADSTLSRVTMTPSSAQSRSILLHNSFVQNHLSSSSSRSTSSSSTWVFDFKRQRPPARTHVLRSTRDSNILNHCRVAKARFKVKGPSKGPPPIQASRRMEKITNATQPLQRARLSAPSTTPPLLLFSPASATASTASTASPPPPID